MSPVGGEKRSTKAITFEMKLKITSQHEGRKSNDHHTPKNFTTRKLAEEFAGFSTVNTVPFCYVLITVMFTVFGPPTRQFQEVQNSRIAGITEKPSPSFVMAHQLSCVKSVGGQLMLEGSQKKGMSIGFG